MYVCTQWRNTNLEGNLERHRRIRKAKNHFVEKREHTPAPAEIGK